MTGTITARPPRRIPLIPALPRPARVVLGGDFVSAVGSGLTLPCLFIYAHQVRDLRDGMAGLVVATIALASLAGNPVGGALADRWTPRRALMAGLTVAAAGSVALALARSAAALFGAAGLLGLGVAVIWPAQDALLASLAGPSGRSAVFSVRHASMNAGLGLGALGAAAVVSVAHPGTFTAVYLADAVSFLAFVPVLARLRIPAQPVSAPEPGRAGRSGRLPAGAAGPGLPAGMGAHRAHRDRQLRAVPVQLRRVRHPARRHQHARPQPGLRGQHADRDGRATVRPAVAGGPPAHHRRGAGRRRPGRPAGRW